MPSLTAPTNGADALYATAIGMSATSPDSNLNRMAYILDPGPGEIRLGHSTTPPYYRQWPIKATVSLGSHTLVARAERGNRHTDSAPVTVNVQPAVPATLAAKGGIVLYNQQTVNAWNAHPEIKQACLIDQNPRWWRNYVASPEGVVNPLPGGGWFIPMLLWPADRAVGLVSPQPSSVTPENIAIAVANAGGGYISAFAEFEGQGYSVAEAVAGWHTLITNPDIVTFRANGGRIISPYTIQDGSGAGSIFRQFLAGVAANGDPDPDDYSLDKYTGAGLTNAQHISQIMARVNNYRVAFPDKHLWLQEYAIDDATGSIVVPEQELIDFMVGMRGALDPLSWVTDLWFYLGPSPGVIKFASIPSTGLYLDDGTITVGGSKWKTLGR